MGAWEDLNESMTEAEADAGEGLLLPPWKAVRASNTPPLNPVLIPGIVRRGYVIELGGKKKVGKTLLSQQLEIRAVVGGEWCGYEIPGGLRCMHIDPEVHPNELDNRFAKICEVMGANKELVDSHIVKWSLRGVMTPSGKPATISDVAHDVEVRCKPGDFDLVVIDSASALLEGDENSAIEIRKFFNTVLRISNATGATVLVVTHFGKAKDGDRDAADRVRGSSVWGDAPDAILTVTQVFPRDGDTSDYLEDGEMACILESGGLRSFGFFEPVPLIFSYPCHRVDTGGITDGWKPSSSTGQVRGGKQTGELNATKAQRDWSNAQLRLAAEFLRRGIGADGLPMTEAAKILGTRSDKLCEKLNDKGSDLFTYDKRKGKNYIILKDVPEQPPRLEFDEQPPTCPLI